MLRHVLGRVVRWASRRPPDPPAQQEPDPPGRPTAPATARGRADPAQHQALRQAIQNQRNPGEDVPGPQGRIARQVFEALTTELSPDHLSFGGGTVLAARWQHRTSLDVDLFCQPDAYLELDAAARARLERQIALVPGCDPERTWCEPVATYTEIDGIEATVLPTATRPGSDRCTRLAGTALRLQTTEEILYAKIMHRMYSAQQITVRDVYDLACARTFDPEALGNAIARIGPDIVADVKSLLTSLPRGWSDGDARQLVDPARHWDEDALRAEADRALAAGNPRTNAPGTERA